MHLLTISRKWWFCNNGASLKPFCAYENCPLPFYFHTLLFHVVSLPHYLIIFFWKFLDAQLGRFTRFQQVLPLSLKWPSIVLCPTSSTQSSAIYKLTGGLARWSSQYCNSTFLWPSNNIQSSSIYKLTNIQNCNHS